MHGNPPPLKVVEPLSAPAIPSGEWWSGVGRVDWLADGSVKFAAVRLSRTIPQSEMKAIARAGGGEAVYVHWQRGLGVKWDFAK